MDFPVLQQLITNKREIITQRQVQDKNREQPLYSDPFFRPPPSHQINYDQKVRKLAQLQNQR